MKKILIALLIGTVSSVSLAKGGFFQSCRDPNTGTVTYSSDCLDIPKKASPYAVNDDRDQVVSIRKNFDDSLSVKFADGYSEHLYKQNNGTYSSFLELPEPKR